MGVLQGIFGALGGGANYALIADAVDKGSGGGGDGADGGGGGGGNSNAARDYTILQTLGANLPGKLNPPPSLAYVVYLQRRISVLHVCPCRSCHRRSARHGRPQSLRLPPHRLL